MNRALNKIMLAGIQKVCELYEEVADKEYFIYI